MSLEDEIRANQKYLFGKILNAGCGNRPIAFDNAIKVVNMDCVIFPQVDIVGDLESIPYEDASFDSIFCGAVLEHCRRPWKVVEEFSRVVRREGNVVCCVPFMQPIHKSPTDYFRCTPDGLKSLFEDQGFAIIKEEVNHSIFHVMGWIMEDAIHTCPLPMKFALFPFAKINYFLSRFFCTVTLESVPSAVTVVAQKI